MSRSKLLERLRQQTSILRGKLSLRLLDSLAEEASGRLYSEVYTAVVNARPREFLPGLSQPEDDNENP